MSEKPLVRYILSDEHHRPAVSHAGAANVRTPWMDRLAREGVSFHRTPANCSFCAPSRRTMRRKPLALVALTREPFFDVVGPHGMRPAEPTLDMATGTNWRMDQGSKERIG